MTVTTSVARQSFADSDPAPFNLEFSFFDASDLLVIERAADGVETVKILTTDYTVDGGNGAVGSVTPLAALPVGASWSVYRNTPRIQETDYVENDALPAESHEKALDRLAMIAQEVARDVERALHFPKTDTSNGELQNNSARANAFLKFDENGLPTADPGPIQTTVVSGFMADLLNISSIQGVRDELGLGPGLPPITAGDAGLLLKVNEAENGFEIGTHLTKAAGELMLLRSGY